MPDATVLAGIQKDIAAYEASRAAAFRQVLWRTPVFIGAVLVAVYLVARFFNTVADPHEQWLSPPHVFLYVAGFIALIAAYFLAVRPAQKAKQSFRDRLLPIAFGFIEDVRYRHGATPASFDRIPHGAIGPFAYRKFDDVITGRYDGFSFELYELEAWQTGRNEFPAFKGLVVVFDAIQPFPGTLAAVHRPGAIAGTMRSVFSGDLFGATMKPVDSGVAEVDAAYEFRSDNVAAAQPLVSGRLAKALQWLAESWPQSPARIALTGGDGFLLLPDARNFFELPPLSQPVDYKTHIEPMIARLVTLLATASLVRKVTEPGDA